MFVYIHHFPLSILASYWNPSEQCADCLDLLEQTAYIIKWSIVGGIFLLSIIFVVVAYFHAQARMKKGLRPLGYHRVRHKDSLSKTLSWLMYCHSGWYQEDRGCNSSRHIRISIWRIRSTTEGRMAMLWMAMHRLHRVRFVFLSGRSPISLFWLPSFLRPLKPSTALDLHGSVTDLQRQSTTAITKMLQTTCLLTELRK
jgi:hypothetical protein